MADAIDEHIDGFLADFRAQKRPFTVGAEQCGVCGQPAITYCKQATPEPEREPK